jgi:RNA polymerase sigma factor (sigma-70 family)
LATLSGILRLKTGDLGGIRARGGSIGAIGIKMEAFFQTRAAARIHMDNFDELYRTHVQSVFRFAMSVVGDRETAEDLTSEAFLALHRNLKTIDQSLLPAWLLTVVRNRARDLWRRKAVETRALEGLATTRPEAAEPPLERWILDSPELRPVHRTCLMLRYVHEMTRTEIAAKLGLSETQVKGYLQYGLALLRKAYKTRETA